MNTVNSFNSTTAPTAEQRWMVNDMKKKINGLVWDISIVSGASAELLADNVTCRGTTWCGHQKICLSADLTALTARRVIAHELTHAFLWSTQMRIPETFSEEEVCEFVACWGYEIQAVTEEVYAELYYSPDGGKDNG